MLRFVGWKNVIILVFYQWKTRTNDQRTPREVVVYPYRHGGAQAGLGFPYAGKTVKRKLALQQPRQLHLQDCAPNAYRSDDSDRHYIIEDHIAIATV